MTNPTLKLILLITCIPLFAFGWNYDDIDFPGDLQGWDLALNSTKYTGPDGSTEWFRYQFSASSSGNPYFFKMTTASTYNNSYGNNSAFPKNEVDIMYYGDGSLSASQLAGGGTNGYRYVFTTKNP